MTDDRSLERAARSWLEDGPTRAPDRPVEAALSRIKTTTQERDLWIPWRLPTMFTNRVTLTALAIVFVIAAGGFALSRFGGAIGGPGGPSIPNPPESPSVTVAPTATPVPSPSLPAITSGDVGRTFPAGTYQVEGFAVAFTVQLPDGWEATELTSTSAGFADSRDATVNFFLAVVNKVYSDPCHAASPSNRPTAVRPGVDALVTALASITDFQVRDSASTTVGGASGQAFTFANTGGGLGCGDLLPFATRDGDGEDVDIAVFPGETDRFWVLDAKGTTVLVAITDNQVETVQPVLETVRFLEPTN
jgi:hypothetical protein